MTDGKRQFRRWSQFGEEVYFDAIGREYIGGGFGKKRGIVTAVVCNGYRNRRIRIGLFEVVAQALCRHTDGVHVDPVGSGPHNSPKSSGSEFEIFIK